MSRRVIFRKAPAAAPAPRLPILLVKARESAPVPLEPVPDPDPSFDPDWGKPMTGHMFDLIAKALHEGSISVEDAVRANNAWLCFKPLPHDLIELVVALA